MKYGMKNLLSVLVFVTVATGCSLKDRNQSVSVSVQLPKAWQNSSSMDQLLGRKNYSSYRSHARNNFPDPTTLGDFQCYALNVYGAGIKPSANKCNDSSMGQISDLVPAGAKTIDMTVPSGNGRIVQLIGVQSTAGCPAISTIINSDGNQNIGDAYVLGSSDPTDMNGDTTVAIVASFNATTSKKAFGTCQDNHNGGGGTPSLSFQLGGGNNNAPTALQTGTGTCTQAQINLNNVQPSAMAGASFTITESDLVNNTGKTKIYPGPVSMSPCNCATAPISNITFTGNNQQSVCIQTIDPPGTSSFTVALTPVYGAKPVIANLQTPVTTVDVVANRLGMMTNGQTRLGQCTQLQLSKVGPSASPSPPPVVSMGGVSDASQYLLSFRQNWMGGNGTPTAPSMNLYSDPLCATLIPAPAAQSDGSVVYTAGYANANNISFATAAPVQAVYMKDVSTQGEWLSYNFYSSDNSMQPTGNGGNFTPWTSLMVNGNQGPDSGGGSISIMASGGPTITAVKIGTASGYANCPITGYSSQVMCTPPAGAIGSWPIYVVANGNTYNTGANYQYMPGISPQSWNIVYTPSVTPTPYQIQFSGGATLSGCTPYTNLPAWLTLNPDCTISANAAPADSNGSGYYVVNVNGNAYGGFTISSYSSSESSTTFSNSTSFYDNGCTLPGSGCNGFTGNYTLMLNQPVNMYASGGSIAGVVPTTCSISPALTSTGLTFNSDCSITGTPNSTAFSTMYGTTYHIFSDLAQTAQIASIVLTVNAPPLAVDNMNASVAIGSTLALPVFGGSGQYTFGTPSSGSIAYDGIHNIGTFTPPVTAGSVSIAVTDVESNPRTPYSTTFNVNFGSAPIVTPSQTYTTNTSVSLYSLTPLSVPNVDYSSSCNVIPVPPLPPGDMLSITPNTNTASFNGNMMAPYTGTLYVSCTNGFGTSPTVSVSFTVNPAPLMVNVMSPTIGLNGTTSVNVSGGIPPYTYTVNTTSGVGGSVSIVGPTPSMSVTFTAPNSTGTSTVSVTDSAMQTVTSMTISY